MMIDMQSELGQAFKAYKTVLKEIEMERGMWPETKKFILDYFNSPTKALPLTAVDGGNIMVQLPSNLIFHQGKQHPVTGGAILFIPATNGKVIVATQFPATTIDQPYEHKLIGNYGNQEFNVPLIEKITTQFFKDLTDRLSGPQHSTLGFKLN